jgi:hypothetical protein
MSEPSLANGEISFPVKKSSPRYEKGAGRLGDGGHHVSGGCLIFGHGIPYSRVFRDDLRLVQTDTAQYTQKPDLPGNAGSLECFPSGMSASTSEICLSSKRPSVARFGVLDMCAQAEVLSALRTDTPRSVRAEAFGGRGG